METPQLGAAGREFWTAIVGDYGLSPSEFQILSQICKTLDILSELDIAINENGVMIGGSKGQLVCNPAITEARGQRVTLHRLIAALAIPDDAGNRILGPRAASTRAAWAQRRAMG